MNPDKEKLLNEAYNKFIEAGFYDLHLDSIDVAENLMGYGTGSDEKCLSISDFRNLLIRQREQSTGIEMNFEITPVFRRISDDENAAIFVDEIKITMLISGDKHELFVRLTSVLEYSDNKWTAVHFHGSKPVESGGESDTWHVNEWKRRNEELEKLVAEKTADLKQKNRELVIESSLERVRAVALGMKKPDDLLSICKILFAELHSLGFSELRNAMINIHDDDAGSFLNYDFSDAAGPTVTTIFYNSHPATESLVKQIRKENDAFAGFAIKGNELDNWREYRKNMGEKDDPKLDNVSELYYYFYSIGIGGIGISNYGSITEEKRNVLKRFRNVFDFAYRRYMDVATAEAQAREAKIEAALEKVRGKAMAMNNSSDLIDAAGMVFTELNNLGIKPIRSGFVLLTKESRLAKLYPATSFDNKNTISFTGEFEFTGHPVYEKQYQSWQKKENYFPVLEGDILKSYYKILAKGLSVPYKNFPTNKKQFGTFLPFTEGFLFVWSDEPYSEKEINILDRFKGILDLTIRRYIDLKNAEVQTREAQIEASLERVRGKAMAMHSSEDLSITVNVFFKELKALGITPIRCGVTSVDENEQTVAVTATTALQQGESHEVIGKLKMAGHPVLENILSHWKLQQEYHAMLTGKELKEYYAAMSSQVVFPDYPADAVQYCSYFYFKEGWVYAWTEKELTEEQIRIFRRFTSVISLTYRRYIDLKKAEAQARESQIEASLERVRSKAMAMHSSQDLSNAVEAVFEELDKLNIGTFRCGIGILDKEKRTADAFAALKTDEGMIVQVNANESMDIHPLLKGAFDAWLKQESYSYVLEGKDIEKYYQALDNANFILPDSKQLEIEKKLLRQYYYLTPFQWGALFAFSENEFADASRNILKRFADVINFTYSRFNDLKLAEAQTREAQIEVALERVRARALAMQEPEELVEVAQVFRHEMELLGMQELETGIIFTQVDSLDKADCWFAIKDTRQTDNNLVSDHIIVALNQTWVGREMLRFYSSEQNRISIPMKGEHRKEWIEYCYSLSSKLNNFYGENIPDRTYHLYKFSNGSIGAASPGDLSEESRDVLTRAASVFSLAYSRFKDLTQSRIDLQNLKDEKKRSDSLLLNILPEEIANELKQFGKSYARKHEQVSILFADITMFSAIAENLSADELVTQLDECFRAFDNIVEKHGMEKIKTIGDAYICACGLPKPVADNAIKTVTAALDMLEFIKGFGLTKKIQNLPAFEFRIGIHTGPVITGVVGLKKFTYDIWGDAVNMAARMEQHGESGKINISGNTYRLVKDKFTCTYRGKIQAKNKGEVDMYFVEGIL